MQSIITAVLRGRTTNGKSESEEERGLARGKRRRNEIMKGGGRKRLEQTRGKRWREREREGEKGKEKEKEKERERERAAALEEMGILLPHNNCVTFR
jgi:hypothetical protein